MKMLTQKYSKPTEVWEKRRNENYETLQIKHEQKKINFNGKFSSLCRSFALSISPSHFHLLKIHHNDNPVRASAWHQHLYREKREKRKKINRKNVVIHCIRNTCTVCAIRFQQKLVKWSYEWNWGWSKWKRQICEQCAEYTRSWREWEVNGASGFCCCCCFRMRVHTKWCKCSQMGQDEVSCKYNEKNCMQLRGKMIRLCVELVHCTIFSIWV